MRSPTFVHYPTCRTRCPGGEEAFITAESATAAWEITDYEQAAAKNRELLHRMANLVHRGVTPGDHHAQELIDEHHTSIARFWKPDATSYSVLADLYLSDDQQRAGSTTSTLPYPWHAAAKKTDATHRPSSSAVDS